MKLAVSKSSIRGQISVPGSKSHTIRAIAIASVADGVSIIKAPLVSEDTLSALGAASALGAWIKRGDDSIWRIAGNHGNFLQPASTINLENSGTSLRLFSGLASLASFPVSFDGDESLRTRKMGPLLSGLKQLGAKATAAEGGFCPLTVEGPLQGGEAEIDGVSSQYVSGILIAAPLCPKDTILRVVNPHEIPYIGITLGWLESQGIEIQHDSAYTMFHIKGGQSYKEFTSKIPGDFSTAAFPLVAGVITGGNVAIKNLDFSDTQGDKAIFEYLEKMGAKLEIGTHSVTVKGRQKLHAVELDINATPDALPILAVAAATADGITVLKNVKQARMKETDRISCMACELEKMGIAVEEFEDGMAITGGKLKAAHVESYKDHRIAMSLAIAGMVADDSEEPTVVDDAESISVTFPNFIEDFKAMGAEFYTNL